MKKFLPMLLCLILIMNALPVQAGTVTEVMSVYNCNEWVSLRKEANASSQRLEKVYFGELVTDCVDAGNGFIRCDFNGKTGYIDARYLKKTSFTMSDGLLPNQMVVHCTDWVSLREKPDTSSKRLAKVPLGDIVTGCVSWMGSFVYCEYQGKRGYISAQYLMDADYSYRADLKKEYPPIAHSMTVVNCNEWVSLRELPTSKSGRLCKVPLGAWVDDCKQVTDHYVYCTYEGHKGYIDIQYLEEDNSEIDESMSEFDGMSDFPSYELFCTLGSPVLEEKANGYTIVARRDYTEFTEILAVVCYDESMTSIWSGTCEAEEVGQVDATEAFIQHVGDETRIVVFISGDGFYAYNVGPWQDVIWDQTGKAAHEVGGGLLYRTDTDGTIYCLGYFDDRVLCMNPDGSVKWQTVLPGENVYWPFLIDIDETQIRIYFEGSATVAGIYKCVTMTKNGIITQVSDAVLQ